MTALPYHRMDTVGATADRWAGNIGSLRANLYNAGLKNPGCEYAYMGAMLAGAGAVEAFEAARICALLQTPADLWETHSQRRYQFAREYREMLERQQDKIARIKALPNPYEEAQERAA